MSTTYTCNTCVQQFPNSETQREHMKTDWHRYNLKRKVAGLLPIAANVFASKVLQQSEAVPERRQKQIDHKEGNEVPGAAGPTGGPTLFPYRVPGL